MASFKFALGAFALTFMTATAGAAPVEVVFDVTVTTRTGHEWFDGTNHVMTDPDFEPISLSFAYQFDPALVLTQHAVPGGETPGYALTRFVGGTGTPAFTPLYPMVHGPTPPTATEHSGSDVSYGKNLLTVPVSPEELVDVQETASFLSYAGWSMPFTGKPDAVMQFEHRQLVSLQQPGWPLHMDQFSVLTGAQALAFLQAQVGVVQVGAYSESGGIVVQQYVGGVPQGTAGYYEDRGILFTGDVTIRSVTPVPEADALWMGLAGMAVLGSWLGVKRRALRASDHVPGSVYLKV